MQTADALRSGTKGLLGNGPNTKPGLGHRDNRCATGQPRAILACAPLRREPAFGGRAGLLRPPLRRSERPNRFQAGQPRPSPNSTSRPSWSRRNYEGCPRRARRICILPPMIATFATIVCILVILSPWVALFAFRKQPLLPRIALAAASPVAVFVAAIARPVVCDCNSASLPVARNS